MYCPENRNGKESKEIKIVKARRKEKAAKAESQATVEAAKVIARDIGLEVDWDSSCCTCIIGLSRVIVNCGHKRGLYFISCIKSRKASFGTAKESSEVLLTTRARCIM